MRRIWILTLFPEYFTPLKEMGVVARAFDGLIDLNLLQIRDFAKNNYKSVDDTPYGGGPGMVIRNDILLRALEDGVLIPGNYGTKREFFSKQIKIIYTAPHGKVFNNNICKNLCNTFMGGTDLLFICGRYEGIDQRFINEYVDEILSIGDFVLSGGEIAVLAILDALIRQIPGILGNADGLKEESFEDGLLEYPHYTKPKVFKDQEVPEILLSGHHSKIKEYRKQESIEITRKMRPDLYQKYCAGHKQ